MKAAVVDAYDRPLSIEDVPAPKPGPEQVLVCIEASGLGHPVFHLRAAVAEPVAGDRETAHA